MNKMIRAFTLLVLLLLLAGCAPEPNDDYNPTDGSPTHEKMFESFFGIQKDHYTFVDIFIHSNPPKLLAFSLDILWFLATAAFIIIMVVGGIKSTLQAPNSQSLLGQDISTPLAPVRIGLTGFLLLTMGSGHYSVAESLILSANKYVSAQANKLYTSQVENYRDEYIAIPSLENSPSVNIGYSKDVYFNLFRTAMCIQYAKNAGFEDKVKEQSIAEIEDYAGGDDSATFMFARGTRYNVSLRSGFFSWGSSPVDGGCGQWYFYSEPPAGVSIIPDKLYEYNLVPPAGNLNQLISRNLQLSLEGGYRQIRRGLGEFQDLAHDMIAFKADGTTVNNCGTDSGSTMTCEQHFSERFSEISQNYGDDINAAVQVRYRQVLASPFIGEINDDAIDTARNHGWFFAGALPYMFASSAERLGVFSNIALNTTPPKADAFPKAHKKKLKEYFAFSESVLGMSSSTTNAALMPRDDVTASYGGTYLSCLVLEMSGGLDCLGAAVSMETLSLTRMLATGVSHPLTATHRVGKSGANAMTNAQITLNALQATALVASATLVGPIPFWGDAMYGAISTIVQTVNALVTPFLEFMALNYTVLGFFVVLMPFVYFSIAIVSYIVTLFVSVLAANFFAVSHAWLEGQGVVSSYAQRGYPSLIFSALTPLLVIMVFFIYLYTMPFVFQFLGYAYNLFLTPFMEKSLPGVYGGIFFFTMLVFLIIAVHRFWARLLLTIPDRVMRLIGVHEALSQNDFSGEIDRGGQESAGMLSKTSSAAGAATHQALAGNAGGNHQSVLPGDSPSGGDAGADTDSGGESRDTSGYSSAASQRGGARTNPRNTGLLHMAAAHSQASKQNVGSGGEQGGVPPQDVGQSQDVEQQGPEQPQGTSADVNNPDQEARNEAIDSAGSNDESSPNDVKGQDGNDGRPGVDGTDSDDSLDKDDEARQQASDNKEKTSNVEKGGGDIEVEGDSQDDSQNSEADIRDEVDSYNLDDTGHHDDEPKDDGSKSDDLKDKN